MQEEEALEFFDRLAQGTKRYKTISLEHKSGATLNNVEMHPISKRELAGVIERLPEEMFDSVEGAEDAEDAEEQFEEEGGDISAVTEDTIDAFEDLIVSSLKHDDLTTAQMETVAKELDFETLFEIGTEIINMSVENTGDIRGFREQG